MPGSGLTVGVATNARETNAASVCAPTICAAALMRYTVVERAPAR